jgi:Skp family chaperone for outer membrane proteins
MSRIERLFFYGVLSFGLFLFARATVRPAAALPGGSDTPPRIAVCSVIRITDELMDTDRFKPARVEYEDGLREELLKPVLDLMQEVQEEARGLKEDDPKLRDLGERHRSLQRQAQQATQQIAQRVEQRVAEQLIECYGLVRASAVAIAEQQGYTHLLASTDPEEELKTETVMKLVRDFLARPVLLAPKGSDITEDVRTDLKLD